MKIRFCVDTGFTLPLSKILPFQNDMKTLPAGRYLALRKEIEETGFSFAPHVWKDNAKGKSGGKFHLLDGHQRIECLKRMAGEDISEEEIEVPVVLVDAKDFKEAKRKCLAAASQYGEFRLDGLKKTLLEADIKPVKAAEMFHFPTVDLKLLPNTVSFEVKKSEEEDEKIPPPPKKSRMKLGEIYQLGDHRLMCGDSTSSKDVSRLITADAALCFTSPPYADQREYGGGLDLSVEHLATFITAAKARVKYFAVNLGYARRDGEVLPYWDAYIAEARKSKLKLLSWNIWDRGCPRSIGQQTAMFPIEHEWIFVFGDAPAKMNLTVPNASAGTRTGVSNRQADGSLSKKKPVTVRDHRALGTIVRTNVDTDHSVEHPAKFPVALPEAYILAMSEPGECVYEPFGGSGSTLIAAEKTGRSSFLMELDPIYCEVILQRWENFTGRKAQLAGG